MTSLSVLITSFNERENLVELSLRIDSTLTVNVVDSGSSDGSHRVVTERDNWYLHEHPYESQASQLNWALDNVVDTDWVLILDCDERLDLSARDLHLAIASSERDDKTAIAFRRNNYFGEKLVRHGGFYPDWQVRLLKSTLRYEPKPIHSHVVVDVAAIQFSDEHISHQSYVSVDQYVSKYGKYLVLESLVEPSTSSRPTGRQLQELFQRLPFPGLIRFIYAYFYKRGFMDGRLGFYLALWAGYRASVGYGTRKLKKNASLDGFAEPTFGRYDLDVRG